jgi:hypothetical protein
MTVTELRDILRLADASGHDATPGPAQNTSAPHLIGPSSELNNAGLSPFAAEPAAKNAYLTGTVRQDPRRVLRMVLKSPIAWLCFASVVIAASVSVVRGLSVRSTTEKPAAANALPNSARPGLTGASVTMPDPSTPTRATATVATAIDQNPPGEPRSSERMPDPEGTEHLNLSTTSSAEPPDLTAAALTANERTPEIAAVTLTPIPAAPPPSAAPSVPKPEANPAVARLEMPKDTSPNVSASPDGRVLTPTAVILPSKLQASTAKSAPLLSRGEALFGRAAWLPLDSSTSAPPISETERRPCDWLRPTIRIFLSRFTRAGCAAISQWRHVGINRPATSGASEAQKAC